MKKWKIFLILLQLGFVYLAVTWSFDAGRNYAGYCIAEDRILSDDEMIRIAVGYLEKQKRIYKNENRQLVSYEYMPYISIDEFFQKNPNCCSFGYNDMKTSEGNWIPPNWINRVNGYYAGNVKVNRIVKHFGDDNTPQEIKRTDYVLIRNCGKPYFMNDY